MEKTTVNKIKKKENVQTNSDSFKSSEQLVTKQNEYQVAKQNELNKIISEEKLTETEILEIIDKVELKLIVKYQTLSLEFILKHIGPRIFDQEDDESYVTFEDVLQMQGYENKIK